MTEPGAPFHLVDRIDSYQPFQWFRAHTVARASSGSEMPGPLVLEALGQAGNWLLLLSTDLRTLGMLASVGSVTFGRAVHPGDVVELEGRIDVLREDAATMSGTASVDGDVVLDARDLMCVLIDSEQLESRTSLARRRDLVFAPVTR